MITLLYGQDDYRIHVALGDIRRRLAAADDMLDSNTALLDGKSLSPSELLANATAVPFLASNRLVIVEGLLAAIGAGRGGRKKKASADDPLEAWRQAAAQLSNAETMPATTTLVLVEGALRAGSAAFPIFAPIAQTVELNPLDKSELPSWIESAAAAKDVRLAPRAIAALAQTIGPDLWTVDRELDKLAAYAAGETVDADMVAEVASAAHTTKIWDLTDAIVAGNEPKALGALRRLLADGDPATVLSFMITRQYRQLIIVKDLRERKARQDEVARAAGVPSFRLSAVGALASRYSWPALRAAYARMLDADLSVKRGLRDDETALQLLVHELCGMAPPAGMRPAYAR